MSRSEILASGISGTASGKIHISKPVAYVTKDPEFDEWQLRGLDGTLYAEIKPSSSKPGYSAWNIDETYGTRELAAHGVTFMAAVSAILGKPPYGYSNYKRGESNN
jgi:hypothetical protein